MMRMNRRHSRVRVPCRQAGLSYTEILVATVLIAVMLLPALEALQMGSSASGVHHRLSIDHYQLLAKMEMTLAEPFADLEAAAAGAATPSSYSDSVVLPDGRQLVREVFLSAYDGDDADGDADPFTGTDEGLLWVKVSLAGTNSALESLARL